MTTARLDYSKPPPGYFFAADGLRGTADGWAYGAPPGHAFVDWHGMAIAAAWAHYKARHDPPGMNALGGFFCSPRTNPAHADARAAAWAWHDRRFALAERLDALAREGKFFSAVGVFEPGGLWPEILTWSGDCVTRTEEVLP